MKPIHVADTRTLMTQIVLPTHANNHGTIFGGQLMAWMDICAAVSAQRFARGGVVTASMDELHFLLPIKSGMILELRAQVNQAWRSSMEIGVRVEAEDPATGDRAKCCSGYLTFVAVDGVGRPRELCELVVQAGSEDARRSGDAQRRREHRLAVRAERKAART